MKNLFEIASRRKYRFPTRKGNASCEDLWDLSLQSLDLIAGTLDASLLTKSFIGKEIVDKEVIEDKLEIVKYIIKDKLSNNVCVIPEAREEIKHL